MRKFDLLYESVVAEAMNRRDFLRLGGKAVAAGMAPKGVAGKVLQTAMNFAPAATSAPVKNIDKIIYAFFDENDQFIDNPSFNLDEYGYEAKGALYQMKKIENLSSLEGFSGNSDLDNLHSLYSMVYKIASNNGKVPTSYKEEIRNMMGMEEDEPIDTLTPRDLGMFFTNEMESGNIDNMYEDVLNTLIDDNLVSPELEEKLRNDFHLESREYKRKEREKREKEEQEQKEKDERSERGSRFDYGGGSEDTHDNRSWDYDYYRVNKDFFRRPKDKPYSGYSEDEEGKSYKRYFENYLKENYADGKKPGRKGLAKRSGVNCKQSVTKLRKIAKNSTGERRRMAHWCANMKSGKKKK